MLMILRFVISRYFLAVRYDIRRVRMIAAGIAKSITSVLCAMILICSINAEAQDCVDYGEYLHLLGAIYGGGVDVAVSDGFVYTLASNSWFRVLDIHDPVHPYWRGSARTEGWPRGVAVRGQVAYVVEQPYASLLHAFDISDPDNPFVISTIPTSGWCQAIVLSNHYAFTLCQGLKVFDISDPSSMVLLDTLYNLYDDNALAVSDDLVAVVSSQFDQNGHLHLIDVSDPADVFLIRMKYLPGAAYSVVLAGHFAYVGGRVYPPGQPWLWVVDIADPQDPVLAAQYEMAAIPRGLAVKDEILYVIDDDKSLLTYKITEPDNPELVGRIELGGTGKKIVFADDIGVAGAGGVRTVATASPTSPPIVGQTVGPASALQVAYAVDSALLACGVEGLAVVDITEVENPAIKGRLQLSSVDVVASSRELVLVGDNKALSGEGAIVAIDASDLGQPRVVGTASTASTVSGIEIAGNVAYVMCAAGELQVFDVTDTAKMHLLGSLELGLDCTNICITSRLALVTTSTGRLIIVDIEDPSNPVARGSVVLDGYDAQDVAVSGVYAYVVGDSFPYKVLHVVDISDVDAPVVVANSSLSAAGRAATINGDILYVAALDAGLQLFDISKPVAPRSIGSRSFVGAAKDIQVVGSFAFIADGTAGLTIVPAQCTDYPTPVIETGDFHGPGFSSIYPNPFNPQTTVSFYSDQPQRVCVCVYDIRGRRIVELTDQQYQVGEHSVEWRGRDSSGRAVPSGEYFFRIVIGGQVETRKAMLLR
jgi:hypothetical protein